MMPELLTTVSPTMLLKVEGAGSHREGSHRKPETERVGARLRPPPPLAAISLPLSPKSAQQVVMTAMRVSS